MHISIFIAITFAAPHHFLSISLADVIIDMSISSDSELLIWK